MSKGPARTALAPAEVERRRAAFRALHASGCFVIPNPWDVGSARALASLGFKALATTSAGFAWTRGRRDHRGPGREQVLAHIREMVEATSLPLNADFRDGYADRPEGVAESVRLCVATGVAGLSIEDDSGNPDRRLYDLPQAVERLKAARAAIDAAGGGVLLTARSECFLTGHPDPLAESLRRLSAYAEAGADVLYAPGPKRREEIAAIVKAAAPKPVNVIVSTAVGLSVRDLAEMGVRRISVGSALARTAWTGFLHAASLIAGEGSFEAFGSAVSFADMEKLFEGD
ncbi:MAG TPA: isocitrate lyase/phosphoenolpyruvate mutase family protein [Spirochaetia bacterium]|nr:isocitrate lyase/phosphoenolpyruvate mutase family protein [Spirochaetia bacterium]